MKRSASSTPTRWMTLALFLALALLGACGKTEPPAAQGGAGSKDAKPAAAGKALNVFMYSEYVDPEILAAFETKTGIKVRLSLYEAAEEMMAKMQQAGGVSQYDVVVSPNHLIPVMVKLNLLRPLDAAKIPNRSNVDPMFVNPPYDPDNAYSLPYQWGTIGLIYRKDKLPGFQPTWKMIFDETLQPASFILMDEIRPMMSAALIALGKSINSRDQADLKAAGDLLLQAKSSKKCLGFDGGVGGKNKVVAGTALLAVVYNGDAVKAQDEDKNVDFTVPDEGTMVWVDCMTVPAKAPNPAGAQEFINFILDAKVGAQLSNFNRYATPNKASLPDIRPADKTNPAVYPTAEQMKKLQYQEDMGKDTTLYDEVWTAVKSR